MLYKSLNSALTLFCCAKGKDGNKKGSQ